MINTSTGYSMARSSYWLYACGQVDGIWWCLNETSSSITMAIQNHERTHSKENSSKNPPAMNEFDISQESLIHSLLMLLQSSTILVWERLGLDRNTSNFRVSICGHTHKTISRARKSMIGTPSNGWHRVRNDSCRMPDHCRESLEPNPTINSNGPHYW